jgi:molybdenum cofactor biosynthesis enzyme
MGARVLYEFEDVGDDLPRPPLAAMRALLASGVVLSPRGWEKLATDARWQLATLGVDEQINIEQVQVILRGTPVSELRLVPRLMEPGHEVPSGLVKAMGPARRITDEQWRSLRGVDRYVLTALTMNTRLLWRCVNELFPGDADPLSSEPWKATVAHCEVQMRPEALERLRSPAFLDGRAFMLARAAGVRTARRASETFDIRSEATCGPVELDWMAMDTPGCILWQAHVSMWDGAFFPAASLAAASAACVALCDIASELDPEAKIVVTRIADEAWTVGGDTYREGATVIYRVKPGGGINTLAPPPHIAPPPPPMAYAPPPPMAQTMASQAPPPQAMPGFRSAGPMVPTISAPLQHPSMRPPQAATMGVQLSPKMLLGLVLGLLVLTCLLAATVIAVILASRTGSS